MRYINEVWINEIWISEASESDQVLLWVMFHFDACITTPFSLCAQVQYVVWHPCAANVLLSSGADNAIIIWNTSEGAQLFNMKTQHPDLIQSVCWNYNGSVIATTCKDKKIRVLDPRADKVLVEVSLLSLCVHPCSFTLAHFIRNDKFCQQFLNFPVGVLVVHPLSSIFLDPLNADTFGTNKKCLD